MLVTKENLIKGLLKYAKQEVLSNINDKPSKMIVATALKAIELNPSLLNKVLDNEMVETILHCENGMYDIETAMKILSSTMDEYGDFPIQLPLIKSPLVFNKKDILKLEESIKEFSND